MASNVQFFKNIENVTMIIFRCIIIFITVAFVFVKIKHRVKKSLSFLLIYFRYVDVALICDFRNKRVNIAEKIQTFQIRRAGTDCLRNPR